MKKSILHLNRRGNLLVVVSLLVLSISSMFAMYMVQHRGSQDVVKAYRAFSAKDVLVSQLERYGSVGASYRKSIDQSVPAGTNSELKRCILGGLGSVCAADKSFPLTLYSPITNAGSTSSAVVASSTAPVRYDSFARHCEYKGKELSQFCPFAVTTTFKANCPGGASSCAMAESISMHYIVTQDRGQTGVGFETVKVAEAKVADVSREEILPPSINARKHYKKVQLISTKGSTVSSNPDEFSLTTEAILKLMGEHGITEPDMIASITKVMLEVNPKTRELADVLVKFRITNASEGLGLVNAKYDVSIYEFAQKWLDSVRAAAITNGSTMLALANSGQWQFEAVNGINQTIVNAGITNTEILAPLVWLKVQDPVLARQLNDFIYTTPDPNRIGPNGTFMQEIVGSPNPLEVLDAIAKLGITNLSVAIELARLHTTDLAALLAAASKYPSSYTIDFPAEEPTVVTRPPTTASRTQETVDEVESSETIENVVMIEACKSRSTSRACGKRRSF